MPQIFYRKKFSDYLGEPRALNDIIGLFTQEVVPTPTPTPSVTPSNTPTPSVTATITPTPSITPTNTQTPTLTPTTTPTSTPAASLTPTPTNTVTPSITPTNTQTPTPSVTQTNTPSITPSITPSVTPTLTPTNTVTPTKTPTPTATSSAPDADATAYLNAVVATGGTLNSTISAATYTLFASLKSNGLYTNIIAMYPLIGGIQASQSIEAKGNVSKNIDFINSWTFNTSGATGQAIISPTGTRANTHLRPSVDWTVADYPYILYYTNLQSYTNDSGEQYDGSAVSGSSSWDSIIRYGSNNTAYIRWGANSYLTTSNTDNIGCYIFRSDATYRDIWKNGSRIVQDTSPSVSYPGNEVFFGDINTGNPGTGTQASGRRYAMVIYGKNISEADSATLSSIINTFQTSLGRNTY